MLLFGLRIWPAILLGAFLVNLTTFGGGIHLAGYGDRQHARSCRRCVPDDALRKRLQVIRACSGFLQVRRVEHAGGDDQRNLRTHESRGWRTSALSEFARIWLTWWLGDVGGFLLFAPLPILWIETPRLVGDDRRLLETSMMLIAIALIGALVFGGALPGIESYPVGFICIPILVWSALRFGQREAATAIFVLTVSADWGLMRRPWPVGAI